MLRIFFLDSNVYENVILSACDEFNTAVIFSLFRTIIECHLKTDIAIIETVKIER